jgi:hypothetical protein
VPLTLAPGDKYDFVCTLVENTAGLFSDTGTAHDTSGGLAIPDETSDPTGYTVTIPPVVPSGGGGCGDCGNPPPVIPPPVVTPPVVTPPVVTPPVVTPPVVTPPIVAALTQTKSAMHSEVIRFDTLAPAPALGPGPQVRSLGLIQRPPALAFTGNNTLLLLLFAGLSLILGAFVIILSNRLDPKKPTV